jgi:hypothetical protein
VSLGRRELIRRGAAAGAGALALRLAGPAAVAAADRGDREVLSEALGLERRLERMYASLARRGGPDAQTAELFASDCAEHARGLAIALANRGGTPGEGAGGQEPGGGPAAALRLETAAVAAYYRGHAAFGDAALLPTLTSIMANHGQHLALLRQRLGREPVTRAFETGGEE